MVGHQIQALTVAGSSPVVLWVQTRTPTTCTLSKSKNLTGAGGGTAYAARSERVPSGIEGSNPSRRITV